MNTLDVRESTPDDASAIDALYPAAFPDEDLLPLVRALLADPDVVLSLVATVDGELAGHCLFTRCAVGDTQAALLGPLAVAPARQRQGAGSALVNRGLERLQNGGVSIVLVLGDPHYYSRFGFAADARVEPPFPLPAEWREAWQSVTTAAPAPAGKLAVPAPWQQPDLWLP